MPSIASELTTYLKTKSAITDLVGSGTNARIYERTAKPKAALPFITIRVFAGTSAEHLGGISGIAKNRIEIRAYAATPDDAYTLAEAIRLAPLQMYRGTMGSTFVNGVSADGGYEMESDRPITGAVEERFYAERDYFFDYQEATS